MDEQTRDNLKNKTTWLRLIYILLFAIAFNIAELMVGIITLVQFFTVLFTNTPNPRLQRFGGDLGKYIRDIVGYLTYQTDHMPFPISDWGQEQEPTRKPASSSKRKTASKKSTRKKTGTDVTTET